MIINDDVDYDDDDDHRNHGYDHENDDDQPALRLERSNLIGEKLLLPFLRLFHCHRHHSKG